MSIRHIITLFLVVLSAALTIVSGINEDITLSVAYFSSMCAWSAVAWYEFDERAQDARQNHNSV
jgi:hypothetical protein